VGNQPRIHKPDPPIHAELLQGAWTLLSEHSGKTNPSLLHLLEKCPLAQKVDQEDIRSPVF
jgi:hypothetical protein